MLIITLALGLTCVLSGHTEWPQLSKTPEAHHDCIFSISIVVIGAQSCPTLHGLQHARLPCPSLSPWICSNSHPLSPRCPSTISFYVAPFSFCPQSFPASGSFPMPVATGKINKCLKLSSSNWILHILSTDPTLHSISLTPFQAFDDLLLFYFPSKAVSSLTYSFMKHVKWLHLRGFSMTRSGVGPKNFT